MSDSNPVEIAANAITEAWDGMATADDLANAVIAALEREGSFKLMGRDASAEMLAAALPLATGALSDDDKRIGARACMLLSGSLNIPNEGDAVMAAAQMRADYRALFDAAPSYATHETADSKKPASA